MWGCDQGNSRECLHGSAFAVVFFGGAVSDGVAFDHKLIWLLDVCLCERQPAKAVFSHDIDQRAQLSCFQQSGGVPEGSAEVALWGGLDVAFGSALLAGLGNVCSGVLAVSGVASGLPLLSGLWGWPGVCAKVVGGAVVLWRLPLQLEEVLQEPSESVASVGVVGYCW